MILEESYQLSNGICIPKLGLGTWFIPNDQAADAVRNAVKIGYRLIDTAQAYGNEVGIGEGVRTCGMPRESVFVGSKIAAEFKTYESAAASIDASLAKMQLDYLDLMLIHSPQPWAEVNQSENRYVQENREVWRALEDALRAGKVRAIGVSNFTKEDLESLLQSAEIKPNPMPYFQHPSSTFELLQEQRNSCGSVFPGGTWRSIKKSRDCGNGRKVQRDRSTAMYPL